MLKRLPSRGGKKEKPAKLERRMTMDEKLKAQAAAAMQAAAEAAALKKAEEEAAAAAKEAEEAKLADEGYQAQKKERDQEAGDLMTALRPAFSLMKASTQRIVASMRDSSNDERISRAQSGVSSPASAFAPPTFANSSSVAGVEPRSHAAVESSSSTTGSSSSKATYFLGAADDCDEA